MHDMLIIYSICFIFDAFRLGYYHKALCIPYLQYLIMYRE